MAEDPEEVNPDDCGAAGLRVEEVAAQVAIDQQHDLRGRERRDRDQHQCRHHQVLSQTKSGIFRSVMPLQRMVNVVAMIFTAAPMLPNPRTRSESAQ